MKDSSSSSQLAAGTTIGLTMHAVGLWLQTSIFGQLIMTLITAIVGTLGVWITNRVLISFSSRKFKGDTGAAGPKGDEGLQGEPGARGKAGKPG